MSRGLGDVYKRQIYNNAFVYGKYGLACAQAILLAIAIAIMSLFQFRLMGVDVEY